MPEKILLNVIARIRCTPVDLERWKAAAVGARRSLSDWLRLAADAAAKPPTSTIEQLMPGFDPDRPLKQFTRELDRAKKAKRKLSSTGRRAR